MSEGVRKLGGCLQIANGRQAGAVIVAVVPLQPAHHGGAEFVPAAP